MCDDSAAQVSGIQLVQALGKRVAVRPDFLSLCAPEEFSQPSPFLLSGDETKISFFSRWEMKGCTGVLTGTAGAASSTSQMKMAAPKIPTIEWFVLRLLGFFWQN